MAADALQTIEIPEEVDDTPIHYLNRDVVMNAGYVHFVSNLHPFPWSWRPRYRIPATAGFVAGASATQRKVRNNPYNRQTKLGIGIV